MKNSVFWDVAPFRSWFLARGFFYPDDGGDTLIRNIGSFRRIFNIPEIYAFKFVDGNP
jgi:hypothetical protein